MEDKAMDTQKETPIHIDHENVDVADIMDQIRQRIAQRPPAPDGSPAAIGGGASGDVPVAPGGGDGPSGDTPISPGGGRGRADRAIRLLSRPFMPIIRPLLDRFIARVSLDANMRIDQASDKLHMRIDEVSVGLNMRIDGASDRLTMLQMRIDEVSDRLNTRFYEMSDRLNMLHIRIDKVSERLNTAQENTKLLHTLAHNLVLDLTKLRIEHEALKSKTRIMEKDFEMLGKREKALEKRVIE